MLTLKDGETALIKIISSLFNATRENDPEIRRVMRNECADSLDSFFKDREDVKA